MTVSAHAADPASATLVRTDSGGAFLVLDRVRAAVPDAETWELLRQAGTPEGQIATSELGTYADAGDLPSLNLGGAFYSEGGDGSRRTYFAPGARVYELVGLADDVIRSTFGDPVPLSGLVAEPQHRERLLSSAEPLDAPANWLAILAYLRSIPPPTVTDPPGLIVIVTPGTESQASYPAPGGIDYRVTTQERVVRNVLESFPMVAPVSDAIWPGTLVQGGSLSSGLVAPMQIGSRAPGTLTVATELVVDNPGAPTSAPVPTPSLSTVTTARQQLLQGLAPRASTGRVSIELATITTEQQVSARLGAHVSA